MGSPSPPTTKLKRESPTIRTGPHRRTSSVSSSCVSLESGDQDVLHSPAKNTPPGKTSPAGTSASSPRTPAGANLGEKSAMKKRRSSIGGADDLVKGLDFSTSSSPGSEEKKLHSFLTKGGGHKKVAQPASVTGQAGSPGKKTGTTPPGKEKLVAARATSASVLSPRKSSEGRPEISKKDISSVRKSISTSEGSSSVNGMMTTTATIVLPGNNAEQLVPTKKTSPLKVSSESKMGKSSPHQHTKPKSELAFTKGRTNSNGESTPAVDSPAEAESKTDYKFSPGVSQDGKIGKKSSPRPSLKSKSSLTSSTGRKLTKSRQDTPSPPQPGRVRTRNDKAPRSEELSRPEMESVEMPVYAEYGYEGEGKSEDVVSLSHKMPDLPLQHGEADEERLTLLASLMVGGNVEDEDMSSLEPGVEPGFGNDTEMPTSWLSEDLPCMFSSLSQLPEPDDSSSNLLGDPPEVLDEPTFQISSSENLLTEFPNGNIIAAEVSRSVVVSTPKSPVSTTDEKFVAADDPSDVSNGVYELPVDHESAWIYESNSVSNMVDETDKFEAELRTQLDATYEHESPQLSVPQVEDSGDKFEAELRTQIDTTFESPQLLVPPVGVVPVTITKSVENGDSTMPDYKFTTHPEDFYISSSTSDNESFVSEIVANGAASLQSSTSRVTESSIQVTGEGESQSISSQKVIDDPTEVSMVVPTFVDSSDKEIFHLEPPSCVKHMISVPDASPPLQEEEGRALPMVEDEILTTSHNISCPDHLVESSDDEFLEEIIGDSDSAQLNLKQSFDDAAELPLVVSRDRVDEFDTNIVSTVASPKEDTCDHALEQYAISPQEPALSTEPEFGAEFFDRHGAFTPTYLDQDMKIFEEYWTHSAEDEFSQSDAGQNDAEDLQPSTMTRETQLRNTVDDEAEKSLPPVELPVSIFPDVGKLKLTVEESINLEPPGHANAEMNVTKVEIADEEIPPRILGWSSPDTTAPLPASDHYQVDTESANQEEVEEFDEVFHLFGGSEELSTSVISFDKSSSPSRPKDLIQESLHPILSEGFHETRFENGGVSDSSVSPRYTTSTLVNEHPHVLDSTAQVVPDLQNGDVEGGTEHHQDISIKSFNAVQDASVDDLHHAWTISGADPEGPADQGLTHEDFGTPPILAMNSNDLIGVNIQYSDDDDASDDHSSIGYLHQGGPEIPMEEDPDSLLGTSIQGASHKSSFETPAMSDTHMGVDSNELGLVNPSMLQEFCDSSEHTAGGGDRNAALTDDEDNLVSDDCIPEINNSQSSPDRDVQVASETDDSRDLGLKISPALSSMVEDDQTILVCSPSAGAAANGVGPSDSNAQLPLVGGINDDIEQTEAEFLSSLDKEVQEPIYDGHVDGTVSLGERQERIEKPIPGLEVDMDFAQEEHQGDPFSSVEGAEIINGYSDYTPSGELLSNSSERKDNFENMSLESKAVIIEVPGQDTSQIRGDDEFQDDERITSTDSLQIVAESHEDVNNVSAVDHTPQNLQLTDSPQGSVTLEDYSTEDGSPSYITTAALDKSPLLGVFDASSTHHLISAACTPVFIEEDEKITIDKFGAESEVNSTASPEIVIPDTEATINDTDTGTASSIEILGKHEAIHDVVEPFVVSAKELPNKTLNEVEEFDRHESQCEVNEENSLGGDHSKLETVDFEEQGRAEQDWEGPLLTVDSSGPKSTTEDIEWDLLREESMFTNEIRPAVADTRRDITEDPEIDQDKSGEEASSAISPSASTPSEFVAYHDPNLQETQLPLGTLTDSSDDQVSRTVDAPEIEKDLMTLADAEFDEDLPEAAVDGPALHDVEIITTESTRTQDMPGLILFVAPSQDTPNADIDDMKEDSDVSWKGDDDEESFNGSTLEQNRLPKDVDTVVDGAEKSFVDSDQDTATTVYVDEREEDSSFPTKTEMANVYLNGRLEEEPLFEDEKAMVFSPKYSYANVSGPDTKHLGDSSIPWMTDRDEESSNGNVENESLLEDEDTVVYTSKDTLDATILGGNEVPQNHATVSSKADSEKDYLSNNLEENTFLKDEDMAIFDTEEMEEQSNISWTAGKIEESLNGSLERDSVIEDNSTCESSPLKDPFNALVEETPVTTTSGVSDIQNHSNNSCTADKDELVSLHRSLEEESLLEDEDTVVERPMESLVIYDQDLPDTAILVDDKTFERHLKSSEKADDEEGKENGVVIEEAVLKVENAMPEVENAMPEVEEAVPKVEKAMSEVEKAMPEVEKAMPEVEKAMPEVEKAMPEVEKEMPEVEKAMPEVEKAMPDVENAMPEMDGAMPEVTTVVDNHDEALVVQSNTNAEALIVDDEEKHTTSRDEEESSNGNILEKESKVDLVQEMVDHGPSESYSAPHLLNANTQDLNGDEMGKHRTWSTGKGGDLTLIRSLEEKSNFEVEETEVDSRKESILIPDGDKTNAATSNVDELEKHESTDKKDESLNRNLEEEESVLEVQEKEMDSSSGNLKDMLVLRQGLEVNGAKQSINSNHSDCKGEDLVCHSNSEDSAINMTQVHESDEADAVHISTDVVSAVNAQVVNTDRVNENGELSGAAAVADCKPSSVIPEMTNGNHRHEVDCPHETDAEAPVLAEKTGVTTSLEANTDSLEEPQSPEATLYPLLATQPPFSGSQQDRLWEEQAEAYSSGGRGTPSRKEDTTPASAAAAPSHDPPSPPGEQLTSSDDQIQPASGPMNNGHVVAGPPSNTENGTTQLQPELKGKGKLHTPLRSLLLEDASKSTDGDSSTPNGVTNSPSFIKRLFRVMSTPSRTGERDVSQTKLHKKSMSMWVSCLGSPQVQQ